MKHNTHIKTDIIDCCRRLYQKNLVVANDGNISVRMDAGDYWFTPSGICKGDLNETDLIRIDKKGRVLEGRRKLTTEYRMHLAIYEVRPDIRAIVHAHPVYATAFATAQIALEQCVLPEIITTIGSVPLAPYGTPSTEELAASVQSVMRAHDVCLMANHGIVAAGSTVHEAYFNIERVEHYAHVIFIAKILGGEKTLDPPAVEKLQLARKAYGTDSRPVPDCKINPEPGEITNRCRAENVISGSSDATVDQSIEAMVKDVIQQLKRT